MTRRLSGGPFDTARGFAPQTFPLGHLSMKSSVYSPISMSRMSQDFVLNHMKSHYQRISSAKAHVDTSPPKSLKLTIKEKDRKRREALKTTGTWTTSNRPSSRPKSFIEENLVGENSQSRMNGTSNENMPGRYMQRSGGWQDSQWSEILEDNATTDVVYYNNEKHTCFSPDRPFTSTPRFERDEFGTNPTTNLSTITFSYKTPPSRRTPKKKSAGEIVWTEEQKYLLFISDVTSDILARGICSDRVINKVFQSHVEKRKDELDEEKMREMITQLKEDLGVTSP